MAQLTVVRLASEVEDLAGELITAHHQHLEQAFILWLFSNAKMTREGNVQLGKGKKTTPELRFLSESLYEQGADFIITLSSTMWRGLNTEQKRALVDHELCHCTRRDKVNRRTGAVTYSWARRGHDVEEFAEIIERHGLVFPAVKRFVQAGSQLALPLEDEPAPTKTKRRRKTTAAADGIVLETQVEPVVVNHGDHSTISHLGPGQSASGTLGPFELEGHAVDLEDVMRVVDEGSEAEEPTPAGMAAEVVLEEGLDDLTQLDATLEPEQVDQRVCAHGVEAGGYCMVCAYDGGQDTEYSSAPEPPQARCAWVGCTKPRQPGGAYCEDEALHARAKGTVEYEPEELPDFGDEPAPPKLSPGEVEDITRHGDGVLPWREAVGVGQTEHEQRRRARTGEPGGVA